ncbi:MAG: PD40 domain-containing protein, partial [Planctomycetaceae bacterium]|nr:PD40 domain-containing protein [Planctomycetaceae bacterium]
PDGRRVAFTTNRDGAFDIAVADLETGRVLWTTGDDALDNFPSWGPDGRLTWVSNRDGGFDIYTLILP